MHIGTLFSAYFILAANSWMQHPVGYKYDAATGRAELTDFWAVMFNKVQLVTFPHVVLSAYMTAGAFVLGVAAYLHLKQPPDRRRPGPRPTPRCTSRPSGSAPPSRWSPASAWRSAVTSRARS